MMIKKHTITIIFISICLLADCQIDTSYKYVDLVKLESFVSDYEFSNITITNGKDSLVFKNINKIKPFAIKKSSTFKMVINSKTNSIVIDNLNEILDFDSGHAIYIVIYNSIQNYVQTSYTNKSYEEVTTASMGKYIDTNGKLLADFKFNFVQSVPYSLKKKIKYKLIG